MEKQVRARASRELRHASETACVASPSERSDAPGLPHSPPPPVRERRSRGKFNYSDAIDGNSRFGETGGWGGEHSLRVLSNVEGEDIVKGRKRGSSSPCSPSGRVRTLPPHREIARIGN